MEAVINNISTRYDIVGQGDNILFLHGWGSSGDAFKRMIAPLQSHFRCITVDLPGFGGSAMPQKPLTLEDYCDFVGGFLEHIGVQDPIVIGHSNGGRIILKMCADRLLFPPKIVLFGSAGIRSEKTVKQRLRQTSFKTIRRVLTLPVIKNYTADMLQNARNHFGSADYNSAPPIMRQTLVNLVNVDLTGKLGTISAPTLLIYGENDTATPLKQAKVIESEIKDCGLCVIKGGSHWCFIEFPGQIDSILNSFLL